MSVPTAFYIPSSSSSSNDITALQTKVSALTTDVNSATDVNSFSTLVKRDATGGFAAATIKLNAIESNGATLDIAAQNGTSTVNVGKGTGVQAINVGNSGTGKTTITLGGGTDEVKVNLPLKNSAGADVLSVGSTACFVGSIGNPSGVGNTFVGTGISTTVGKFGTYNTGMGNLTLAALDTGGDFNVAMGVQALGGVTTGQYNVAVGARAGWDPLPAKCQISGTGCTFIGTDSKPNNVTPLVNATALGSQAVVDASNTIQLGHVGLVAVKTAGTHYAAGLESIGTTLTIAGQNNTNVVNIGSGTGVQTINMGNNGAGATVINLGGAGDTVNISGTLNNVTTTNTQVTDKSLVLNSGGTAATAGTAGIYFEEAGNSSNSYVRVSSDRSKMELKAPTGSLISLSQSLTNADPVLFKQVMAEGFDIAQTPGTGGSVMGYNRLGTGRTTFANNQGAGSGGWEWMSYWASNTPYIGSELPQMTLDKFGNLGLMGNASASTAPTSANHLTNKTYVDGKFTTLSNQNLKTTDVATFAGLILPTTGGTAATLSHYEEYVHNTAFSSATFTGTFGLLFARIGKVVTMTFPFTFNFTATVTTKLSNSVIVPTRFRPFGNLFSHLEMVDNGTRVDGLVEFNDGFITISPAHSADFITGRAYTVYGFSMTWVLQ